MKTWLTGGLVLAVGGLLIAQFVVPSKPERAAAAGSLDGLDPPLIRAFSDDGEFAAKKEPQEGDWLSSHEEAGQTFEQYLESKPNRPEAGRRTIYILPIGEFDAEQAPILPSLREYSAAYFQPMRVWILPAAEEDEVKARSRVNGNTGLKQWNSMDILHWMHGRLPADAYAMIAVTMTDLYPEESWNYVFGQASLKRGVGVFSFARYDPRFWGDPVVALQKHKIRK
jgi:archaemetzincin